MIEKEQILLLTQGGLNVFSHFLGFEVNLHRNFRSPFYDDKRASCHIYYDRKTSSYKFYDHGDTTYSGDCFWFVATLRSLNLKTSFPEVLEIIVQELGLYSLLKSITSISHRHIKILKPPVLRLKSSSGRKNDHIVSRYSHLTMDC